MEKIGKYELIREIGRGATSTVHLAHDSFANRDVALKIIFPEVLADKDRGRLYKHLLINEASLAGKLVHPHIVQIFDAVVDDALSYIVMEYVDGGTLEKHATADNLLPLNRVVEIIFKCTRALNFAYQMGITHRDIKPANILLCGEADIKISDFGAALTGGVDQTQVSGVGSPAYMSPQQVREMPLNHQTDIYSLGVVLYQLLTGHMPFQATNNYSMIYQIVNTTPLPPSAVRPDLPVSLDGVVARAMARDLEDRYQTWEEFAHDLAQAFRNKQLAARQSGIADTEKYETLRRLPFFSDFSDAEIWEVVRFSTWDVVIPDTYIMRDGEPGDFFCFLADGELNVVKQHRLLNILSPGDVFGEMAVISKTSQLRGADVVATTPAKIITIRSDALRQSSEACRMHFYQGFLGVLANRLAMANARLSSS